MAISINTRNKAREYKQSTIRRLDILSRNQCAHPDCTKKLIAEDGNSIISKICHIAAASKNGPRYDATMTDEDRRGYDNLILLCDEHHTIIDNVDNEKKYTVDLLKEWKCSHEKKTLATQSYDVAISNHPLALNKVINAIGKKIDEIMDLPDAISAPNTTNKISFNNITRYEPIIKEFAVYQGKLNKIYEEIEKEGSVKKQLVLYNISSIYHNTQKVYDISNDKIKNADKIIDDVIDKIMERIDKAPNKLDNIDQESVYFSLMIIIVDAFIRCKILEEPPK